MIKVYLKDLSPRVQRRIKKIDCVDRGILSNRLPVTVILPEDVINYIDSWDDVEMYDDEFTDYGEDYNLLCEMCYECVDMNCDTCAFYDDEDFEDEIGERYDHY